MKYLFLIFVYITFNQLYAQKSDNQSRVHVAGNHNSIKVVQGNVVYVYNLNNNSSLDRLAKYLYTIPSLASKLSEMSQDVSEIKRILRKTLEGKLVFDPDAYQKELEKNIAERNDLKNDLEKWKLENSDTSFGIVYIRAAECLKLFDYECFRSTLDSFKVARKKKVESENRNLAQASFLEAKEDLNEFHYGRALSEINESLGYKIKNDQDYLVLKASILYYLGKLDSSIAAFKSILDKTLDDQVIGDSYDILGRCYYDKAEYFTALDNYNKSLGVWRRIGDQTVKMAREYNQIGTINLKFGDFNGAISNFDTSLNYLHRSHPTPTDVSACLNNISLVYQQEDSLMLALVFSKKALDILSSERGFVSPVVAQQYVNMSGILNMMGKFDEATDTAKKSIKIYELFFDSLYLGIGYCYENLGFALCGKHYYKRGFDEYEKALKIFTVNLGDSNPNIVPLLVNMSDALYLTGNFDKAINFLIHALNIQIVKLGVIDFTVMAMYEKLGLSYEQKGDKNKARESFEKAKSIAEFRLGPSNIQTIRIQNELEKIK